MTKAGLAEKREMGVSRTAATEVKRLNLVLDKSSFEKLEKIKRHHGDNTYTQAIKRAIAMLEFIDHKKEEGVEFYLGGKRKGKLQQLVLAP